MLQRSMIRLAFCTLWVGHFTALLHARKLPLAASITDASSLAARYESRIWRMEDGLPESRVQAIAQTPDGYLWIGTSGGLARFDGVRFVVYSRVNTPSMTDDNIHSLAVGTDDSLWIATDGGGILQYKDGRFRSFGHREGLSSEFVNTVLEDSHGVVWAGTHRGLFRFDGKHFERVDERLPLRNISFTALWESPEGDVLSVGPAGLFSMAGGKLHSFPVLKNLGEVYRVRQTSSRTLWLATNRGLKVIANDREHPAVADVEGHSKILVDAITEDHAGNIWLGTHGDGLFCLRGGHETAFRAPAILPDNSVAAVFEDRDQNIWVGTADGLVRLNKPDVQVVNSRDGLSSDNVATVYKDHHSVLWLTTITGKVYRYVHGRIEPFHLPRPANNLEVVGVFEDHLGAFWFATGSEGVVRLANGRATRFTMAEGLRNNGIQTLFEDHAGALWVGTSSGLSRWDGWRFQNYYLEDGLSYGWIRAITEDQRGDLLVGTDRGLNRFHGGKIVPDKTFEALRHDRIWSIVQDSKDTLWIGTRGSGLVRIRNGKISRLTSREGLLSNSIFQVINGGDRLWMSGPSGLSSASFADLNSAADGATNSLAVLSYAVGGNTHSAQMNGGFQPSACIAATGELWFPSVKGAVHLNPFFRPAAPVSTVRLESFLVDDQIVNPTKQLVTGPGRHRIQIEFTSIALRTPEQISFQYQLEGFEDRWTTVTLHRTANYDNLPPGQYRFRVIARSPGGSSQASIPLLIQPHLYQTNRFYVFCICLASLCAAAVLGFREQQARNHYNLRLAERIRIAREMHDTVIQGCLGVSTLVEAAVGAAASDHDQMLECLDNARIHLRLTVDEARQALMDLRHDPSDSELEGSLSKICKSLSLEKGVPITLKSEGSPIPLSVPINRTFTLVAREAIRNAVGHGSPTRVSGRLCFRPSEVRLDIEDDGCGFVVDPVGSARAGHFGMLGMRERMEQIGGSLEIRSCPGVGTTISAALPVTSAS